MNSVLERELERAVEFLNNHNAEILKEHYRTHWKYYEIPVVDLVFTCISCQHSHRLAVGRTPNGLRFIAFYHQDIPECEDEIINKSSYTKKILRSEIDSILGENIKEIDDVMKYMDEHEERLTHRVEDPR